MNGIVYVLKSGEHYKIGRTTSSTYQRVRKLQTGNPELIEILYELETPDFEWMERYLHGLYRDERVAGEWFKLTSDDIADIRDILINHAMIECEAQNREFRKEHLESTWDGQGDISADYFEAWP